MRRLLQFFRDLALLPEMWRHAVVAERARRYRVSPEGLAAFEDAIIAQHAHDPEMVARLSATAPSGRFTTYGT